MSVGTTKSERRRKTRKRPLTLVYVELASANGGMMRDLSEEGFAVRTMMPVRAGESTPFAFSLTEKIRIEGRGQIQWIKENGHVAGVRFLDLTAGTREQIREWLVRPEAALKRESSAAPKEMTLEELRKEIHSVPARPEGKPPSVEEPAVAKTEVTEPAVVAEPAEAVVPAAVVAPVEAANPVEAAVKTAEPAPEIVEAKEPETVAASEPEPVVVSAVDKGPEPEPKPVEPVVAAAAPEPAVAPMEAKKAEPPVAIPGAPVVVEGALAASSVVEGAPVPPDVAAAPAESAPVGSAPSAAAPQRVVESVVSPEPEVGREKESEDTEAPALPRLTLFPRVVDAEANPPASTRVAASQEMAPPKLHWKPIPLVEAVQESEAKAPETQVPETQAGLPDISSILMQPAGKVHAQRPAPPIPVVETLPSWDPESMPRERWSERFSLTSAIVLMSIVALLASLYVFHKEVGQGLIWLGEQLGGVPESSSPAAIPANNTAPRTKSEQPGATQGDPSAQSQQALQPTNTAAPEEAPEDQNTAAKGSTPPMTPPSGVAPPTSASPDTGQNEYTQAMQLRRTKGAAAMQEILRLLWVSVEKGNANAELELAQMYWHGQGVIQNCDQAHILLTAAARKGSAEAQRRLVEFQRVGCE